MKPIVWRVPQEPCNQQRRIWKKPGSHTRAYSGNANVTEPNAAKRERGRTPLIEPSHHHRHRSIALAFASRIRKRARHPRRALRLHRQCTRTVTIVAIVASNPRADVPAWHASCPRNCGLFNWCPLAFQQDHRVGVLRAVDDARLVASGSAPIRARRTRRGPQATRGRALVASLRIVVRCLGHVPCQGQPSTPSSWGFAFVVGASRAGVEASVTRQRCRV